MLNSELKIDLEDFYDFMNDQKSHEKSADLKNTNNNSNSKENEIFTIQKENISLLEKEIKFYKNQKRDFIKSRLDEITNKQEFSVKNFFRLIKIGVEEFLGVKLNYRKLSTEYLGMKNKWYVNDRILDSLRFTDYGLPTSSLNKFKKNLIEIFNEKSAFFDYLIDLHKSMNFWSQKLYSQSEIIENYFSNIDTLEKAYWFGFLLADGSFQIRKNSYRFLLKLEATDLILLKNFGEIINFDLKKINYYREYSKKGKLLRKFRISFTNKLFCENLIKNGFPEDGKTSGNLDQHFPFWIFQEGEKRLAMAMLLGFFDGDGTLGYKFIDALSENQKLKLNPRLCSRSRQFLEDIKNYFKINNNILPKNRGVFRLALGRDFYDQLLKNYGDSLSRKRYYFYL